MRQVESSWPYASLVAISGADGFHLSSPHMCGELSDPSNDLSDLSSFGEGGSEFYIST